MSDMLIAGIICNKCGNTLPPHTEEEHFDINNDIHKCPHNKKIVMRYELDADGNYVGNGVIVPNTFGCSGNNCMRSLIYLKDGVWYKEMELSKKDAVNLFRVMDKYPRKDYVEKKTKKQRAIDAVNKLYSI